MSLMLKSLFQLARTEELLWWITSFRLKPVREFIWQLITQRLNLRFPPVYKKQKPNKPMDEHVRN